MAGPSKGRGAVKFFFWTACAVGIFVYVFHEHRVGRLAEWYYHVAASDGFAVDADAFKDATPQQPALLTVGRYAAIEGKVAVPVKKGERMPLKANGIIDAKTIKAGKRAVMRGEQVAVLVPWEIQMAKGFKFKDTFKHKGIETWPWIGVWNVLIVMVLGLALGLMAEGFTDMMGMKLEKIQHHGH